MLLKLSLLNTSLFRKAQLIKTQIEQLIYRVNLCPVSMTISF